MLSNGILNYVGERAEMASSIEGRPPFLDHKLVEYANTLPPYVHSPPQKKTKIH
jgi:asparagine synthase (glutamine-hydrolysing)